MTTRKTISTLSIAAIALMAAAAPSLAQVQSEQSSKETQGSLAAPAPEQTLAANREWADANASRVGTTELKRASVNNVAPTASPSKLLSASAFKVPNHFTSAEGSRFVNQQANFNDAGPKDPTAKKQFRTDDESVSRTKGITFVPSRGQKLPE